MWGLAGAALGLTVGALSGLQRAPWRLRIVWLAAAVLAAGVIVWVTVMAIRGVYDDALWFLASATVSQWVSQFLVAPRIARRLPQRERRTDTGLAAPEES